MSALQREVLKSKLPPLPNQLTGAMKSRFAGLVPKRRQKDYSPVDWSEYFEDKKDVFVNGNKFRLYLSGSSGPVLLLLHGGGHSALSWAVFAKIMDSMCECQVIAIDFRGHGHTETTDDLNMDADVLAKDVVDALFAHFVSDLPPVLLLGHSMGGAIAVHIGVQNSIPSLKGLVVIDVVEGTALDALFSMHSFLRGRPSSFNSLESAIEWSLRSGHLKNIESAKVSMPGQLKRTSHSEINHSHNSTGLPEISEEEIQSASSDKPADQFVYTWKVDLIKTEKHWKGWFQNMSSLFLSCPATKLLILAGVDRLDRELTIAQMQGKFEMQVLPKCGHMVHEDVPQMVAEIIFGFMMRQKLTHSKGDIKRHMPAC